MVTKSTNANETDRPASAVPPIVPLSDNRPAPAEKLTVTFGDSVAAATAPVVKSQVPPTPIPGGSISQAPAAMPKWVSWSSVIAAQAACVLLLAATFFMPHQVGETGWWTGLKAGSLASALPGALKFTEIAGAIAGLILIPLFRGDARGRFMLNISASLTILLILAMLQQNLIGINLVLLPIAGLLSLAALSAILQARTLAPKSESLSTWQFMFSIAAIVMWVLPALESVTDPAFAQIFNAMGGSLLRGVFAAGAICALLAGVVAISESQGKFSLVINRITRAMTFVAFLMISSVGFAAALSISHVMAGPGMTKGWFGVGVMWLFLLITACVILTWAGLTHQFSRKAISGEDQLSSDAPSVAVAGAQT
jgi:hypothetical protein